MRKYVPYAIVAVVFGLLGFFFTRSGSLSPGQVLSMSSPDDLRALRDKKVVELTAIMEKITDAGSAKKHLPDAQTTYLEISLINSRTAMLGDNGLVVWPAVREQPFANLRTQLDRIAKAQEIANELSPGLDSLFSLGSIRVVRVPDKGGSLRSTVATLRSQLQAYKNQHDGKYPDLKTFGWSQLTQRTTGNGTIADGALARNHETFGPYLQKLPLNPFTDSSKVTVINKVTPDFKATNKANGFIFEESTGRIYGLAADGKIFDENTASADTR
jgi:general secretion pathway protein G